MPEQSPLTAYELHNEWPHIAAMRLHVLAQLAMKEAMRQGFSQFEAEGVEVEVEISKEVLL